MYKVLFASSEIYPLMKTGGLGDVAGSLPVALQTLGCDMRMIMPAYQDALRRVKSIKHVADIAIPSADTPVAILETTLPGTRIKTWLVDHPPFFDRPGNPYMDIRSRPWPDNAARFTLFSRVIAAIALGSGGLSWRPQILHCNDWQTALVPALLVPAPNRPKTVFTIHNLAYQGLYPREVFDTLRLPTQLWSADALEYFDQLCFIKGGLCFADHLTTVSPTYAKEIQTPEYGCGLHGLLRQRAERLTGILNGIDRRVWNPGTDRFLAKTYNWRSIANKQANKLALQGQFGLPQSADTPVIGVVSRLVHQKGIDLLIEALPTLLEKRIQIVILGHGDPQYEQQLTVIAKHHPRQLSVQIGYDEACAHRIEGGTDMFLIPSRFEPCGLTQLYSQRYGTVPIVRAVGGLADTVIDANEQTLASGKATGIVFKAADTGSILAAVERALELYRQPASWTKLVRNGIRQPFSWEQSADQYLKLYQNLFARPPKVDTLDGPGSG